MAPIDRLPLTVNPAPRRSEFAPPNPRPLGVSLARTPRTVAGAVPQCGEHSKTYTVDKKTETTKIIIDGNEEEHPDESEVEREID